MNKKNWKVYIHINLINGKKYIGITSNSVLNRWKNGNGYKGQVFYNAIMKYGWDNFKHDIIFENLTKEQAELLEIILIKYYKSTNKKYGYNVANGGNCIGKHNEETKRKIGIANKGENNGNFGKFGKLNPFYGKHLSQEAKKKISIANKGRRKGIKLSEETKMLMRENHRKCDGKNNGKSKAIICVETNIIYESIRQCAKIMNLSHSTISRICRGKLKSTRGFSFKYYSEEQK